MSVETPTRAATTKQSNDQSAEPNIHSISEKDLDALIERIAEAKEHNLALSVADYDVLLNAILTLANMQERLSHNELTQSRMKKLLGMVNSSEKLKHLRPTDTRDKKPTAKKGRANKAGRARSKTPKIKPTVHHHKMEGLSKGDDCPECPAGKVYKYTPASLLRITAHSPYSAEKHVVEQLRCNGCGEVFSATLPEHVKADGRVDQQYGYSARAMMAINKYFGGSPFYPQEGLQNLFGAHIASSTQWDQCEKVADDLHPIFKHLKAISANAHTFYLDDTTNRILNKVPIEKTRNGKTQWRSGVYTSACLALLNEQTAQKTEPPDKAEEITRRLVLFQSNIGHAGEWLDELLRTRDSHLDRALLMSDALSSNHVTAVPFDKALCNAHARRSFAELADTHPSEVMFALETYEHAWVNNTHCSEKLLSGAERCAYHAEHSLPHMHSLKQWCEENISDTGQVEPNSNLGKAMQYFIRHYDGLSAFCRIPGAPVDNNEIERLIKLIVRGRKNSLFFKNQTGASVSDVITSLLATCQENGVNAFDYLQSIQRNQLQVKAFPQKWLPWNYPQDK